MQNNSRITALKGVVRVSLNDRKVSSSPINPPTARILNKFCCRGLLAATIVNLTWRVLCLLRRTRWPSPTRPVAGAPSCDEGVGQRGVEGIDRHEHARPEASWLSHRRCSSRRAGRWPWWPTSRTLPAGRRDGGTASRMRTGNRWSGGILSIASGCSRRHGRANERRTIRRRHRPGARLGETTPQPRSADICRSSWGHCGSGAPGRHGRAGRACGSRRIWFRAAIRGRPGACCTSRVSCGRIHSGRAARAAAVRAISCEDAAAQCAVVASGSMRLASLLRTLPTRASTDQLGSAGARTHCGKRAGYRCSRPWRWCWRSRPWCPSPNSAPGPSASHRGCAARPWGHTGQSAGDRSAPRSSSPESSVSGDRAESRRRIWSRWHRRRGGRGHTWPWR